MRTCYLTANLLTVAINFIVGPSEPRSLVVFSVNSSSVTLQWMFPETPNGVITQILSYMMDLILPILVTTC